MNATVSIIIPVYNVVSYLREALESVINQTYKKLEIIIINDGSNDGSSEICEEYASNDPRIHILRQDNNGLSAARNAGLDTICGDYVAFLDSDDAYDLNFVEKMVKGLYQHNTDMIVCKFATLYTNKSLRDYRKRITSPTISSGVYDNITIFKELWNGNINTSVWNKLYKRSLWDDVRFNEGHVFEDEEATYRIIEKCRSICVLDDCLYNYRIRPDSISNTASLAYIRDRIISAIRVNSFVNDNKQGVFDQYMLDMQRQHFIKNMMSIFYYLCKIKNSDERKALENGLIKLINSAKAELNLKSCEYKTKIAVLLIQYCPLLFIICYQLHCSVKVKR